MAHYEVEYYENKVRLKQRDPRKGLLPGHSAYNGIMLPDCFPVNMKHTLTLLTFNLMVDAIVLVTDIDQLKDLKDESCVAGIEYSFDHLKSVLLAVAGRTPVPRTDVLVERCTSALQGLHHGAATYVCVLANAKGVMGNFLNEYKHKMEFKRELEEVLYTSKARQLVTSHERDLRLFGGVPAVVIVSPLVSQLEESGDPEEEARARKITQLLSRRPAPPNEHLMLSDICASKNPNLFQLYIAPLLMEYHLAAFMRALAEGRELRMLPPEGAPLQTILGTMPPAVYSMFNRMSWLYNEVADGVYEIMSAGVKCNEPAMIKCGEAAILMLLRLQDPVELLDSTESGKLRNLSQLADEARFRQTFITALTTGEQALADTEVAMDKLRALLQNMSGNCEITDWVRQVLNHWAAQLQEHRHDLSRSNADHSDSIGLLRLCMEDLSVQMEELKEWKEQQQQQQQQEAQQQAQESAAASTDVTGQIRAEVAEVMKSLGQLKLSSAEPSGSSAPEASEPSTQPAVQPAAVQPAAAATAAAAPSSEPAVQPAAAPAAPEPSTQAAVQPAAAAAPSSEPAVQPAGPAALSGAAAANVPAASKPKAQRKGKSKPVPPAPANETELRRSGRNKPSWRPI